MMADQKGNNMNKISFDINNNEKIELVQREHDGKVLISYSDKEIENPDNLAFISPGDFVMLINYYRYIKRNDYQNDFINPTGKNRE